MQAGTQQHEVWISNTSTAETQFEPAPAQPRLCFFFEFSAAADCSRLAHSLEMI